MTDKKGIDIITRYDKKLISKIPELTQQSAQIASPSVPTFSSLDLIEDHFPDSRSQLEDIKLLDDLIQTSKEFLPFLYSYRSIQRSLFRSSAVRDAQQDPKSDLAQRFNLEFQKSFTPMIDKFNHFYEFMSNLRTNILNLIHVNYQPSDVLFEKFMVLFDILFNIETIKLNKAGMNNDLSFFKRYAQTEDPNLQNQLNVLQIFLSTANENFTRLRTSLLNTKETTFEQLLQSFRILQSFLEFLVRVFNQKSLTPTRFSQVLTSIMFVFLIHNTNDPRTNICKCSCIKDICKILAENPIGILYGENSFVVGDTLKKVENFEVPKEIFIPSEAAELSKIEYQKKYLLKNNMINIRSKITELLNISNNLSREGKVSVESLNILLEGLSKMAVMVQLQSKYKFVVIQTSRSFKSSIKL